MLAAPQGLPAQKDTTFVANGNPIVKYKYTADPGAMVHDGKVYIYAGHDECPLDKKSIICSMSGVCSPLRI